MQFIKIKKFFVGILSLPIRNQYRRHNFRNRFFLPNIQVNECNDLPLLKRRINVALCFNHDYADKAAVAILSLVNVSKKRCAYDIYCVVDETVTDDDKKLLQKSAGTSKIKFLLANSDFDESWLDQCDYNWHKSIYWRLMLPKLLPDVDRIIYVDSDVVFVNDLSEADMIEMNGNLIAGVGDKNGEYVNSGFLVMNLHQIRRDNLYEKWTGMSKKIKYKYPDQDLLNETCRGRILYLPLRYNFMPEICFSQIGKGIFSARDISDLKYDTVMIHYASRPRPWDKDYTPPLANIWKYWKSKL